MRSDSRMSVELGVHSRLLPSDLSGPKDQLHLEGREDHVAQGSQEHPRCQEHPVIVSRREGHQERVRGRPTPPGGAESEGHTHSRPFGSRNSVCSGVTLEKVTRSL